MTDTLHQIDYAPPRRKPAWLNRRTATLAIVIAASALAGWITVPRVMQRAALLRAQEALLQGTVIEPASPVAETVWMGSLPGMLLRDERVGELEEFTRWGLGQAWWRAAFSGGRSAGGRPQRLLVIGAQPSIYGSSQPPEITILVYVFEPGGWTRSPTLLHQSAIGPTALPVPPESGWRLAVLPGRADPTDNARFYIELEAGYDATPDERRLTIVGYLMPDDTVRFDWPTESFATDDAEAAQARAATQPVAD